MGRTLGRTRDGLAAGAVAAVLSGVPSTVHALVTGRDPLEATLAAGTVVLPEETRPERLLAAAVPVHLALSLGWTLALDLGVVGRRIPRVRALPLGGQLADHVAYGVVVAAVLRRRASV